MAIVGARTGVKRADAGADTLSPAEIPGETRGARFARRAHRTRLYLYAGAVVALLAFLIALVSANTGRVTVSWVFGSSSVSLVWLVLISAILGLLLGMVLGALFHWRTRRRAAERASGGPQPRDTWQEGGSFCPAPAARSARCGRAPASTARPHAVRKARIGKGDSTVLSGP